MLKMPSNPGKGAAPEVSPKKEAGFALEIEPVEEEGPKMLADFSLDELQAELERRKSEESKGAAEGDAEVAMSEEA